MNAGVVLRRFRSLLSRKSSVGDVEARYCSSDGASVRVSAHALEPDLRIGGIARFSVSLYNDETRPCPPCEVALQWKLKDPEGSDLIWDTQIAAIVGPLRPKRKQSVKIDVPVPVNSVCDVIVEFLVTSTEGLSWQPTSKEAALHLHVSGQRVENAAPDFDYEVMYRGVDLNEDWWTPVGPATRAEYENLGRAKCATLVGLGLKPDSRVLDIGCGTGQLTEALLRVLSPDGLYYGTDLASPAVEFCRAKFQKPQFHFVKNEQTQIPIYGLEFDFIFLGSVFTHMFPADIATMLGEIRRLVADSGCVVADAFVSPEIDDFVGSRAMVHLNENNLLRDFRNHGFSVRELSSVQYNEQCRRVNYQLTVRREAVQSHTPITVAAEGYYSNDDAASAHLKALSFEPALRVGGGADFKVLLHNDGTVTWPPIQLVTLWKTKEAGCRDVVVDEQIAATVTPLSPGETRELSGSVPVPIRSVWDVEVEFHLMSLDSSRWQPRDRPVSFHRHVSGQSAEDAPADFDYEVFYRTVDLQKDWWTPVGPATRAEYETLGRGKCAQLVGLGLNASSRVLDIGCGTGQLTEALVPILSPEGLYYGTELAEPAVQFCRAKFSLPNFHFLKNQQTVIPIEGVEFDFIYLGSVFTHMFPADIAAMLGEIRRLMADSGCVVADAFVSPSIADYVGNRSMVQLNEGNLLAAFRKHGFDVRELSSTNWNEQCRRVIYHLSAQKGCPPK